MATSNIQVETIYYNKLVSVKIIKYIKPLNWKYKMEVKSNYQNSKWDFYCWNMTLLGIEYDMFMYLKYKINRLSEYLKVEKARAISISREDI